jgi:hypothetical protein
MKEKYFQQAVVDMARRLGYEYVYHTWSSRNSPAGFPDLIIGNPGIMIVAELKADDGRITPEQYFWLLYFGSITEHVYLWKPDEIEEIVELLQRLRDEEAE